MGRSGNGGRRGGCRDESDDDCRAGRSQTYSLSDFIGKQAVVIAWFPKAFTSG